MDIKPAGMTQAAEVDLLYQIVSSIQGICAKLDDDGTVSGVTFEANCFTAMFKGYIEDSKGNRVGTTGEYFITPRGIDQAARVQLLYEIFNALETLTEQLDADGGVADTDYEANCYEALLLWKVENAQGNTIGNGTTYWFRPGGVTPKKELIDLYAAIVNAIETLTEQLDADATVTDEDYEALWFTANILTKVTNSVGTTYGN